MPATLKIDSGRTIVTLKIDSGRTIVLEGNGDKEKGVRFGRDNAENKKKERDLFPWVGINKSHRC